MHIAGKEKIYMRQPSGKDLYYEEAMQGTNVVEQTIGRLLLFKYIVQVYKKRHEYIKQS